MNNDVKEKLLEVKQRIEDEINKILDRQEFLAGLKNPCKLAEWLGYNLVDKVHYEVWEQIEKRSKPHVLLLMHRHSIKSTIFNYVDNVRRLIINPTTTGLIYSATQIIARSQLDATKNIIENNKKLTGIGINIKGKIWTRDYIRVLGAEGKLADNTYSLETGGVDKSLTAKHYDFMKIDDIQNEVNAKHKNDRENVIEKFRALFNLQKRDVDSQDKKFPCEIFVIGTRYHPQDVYQVIIDELKDVFEIIIVKATKYVNGIEVPVLPKVYPNIELLKFVKKELGEYGYECQMNQNPYYKINTTLNWDKIIPMSDDELNKILSDIKNNKIPQEQIALILDPAEEVERMANYSALSLLYFDNEILYILRCWKIKGTIDDITNLVVDVIKEFGLKYFYCEKSGLENNIRFFLTKKLAESRINNYVVIEPVSHKKEAKNSRIMALQPLINDGKVKRATVFMFSPAKDAPPKNMFDELQYEISTFPNSNCDDLLDTIAYSLREEVFDISTKFYMPDIFVQKQENLKVKDLFFENNEKNYVEFI